MYRLAYLQGEAQAAAEAQRQKEEIAQNKDKQPTGKSTNTSTTLPPTIDMADIEEAFDY
jgi:hypothetical protein